ncbi:MAG: hypothetical protein IMW99_03795 [Firmicutes bacterium]|nr:hypothetical protein [Bacillota bacterium]
MRVLCIGIIRQGVRTVLEIGTGREGQTPRVTLRVDGIARRSASHTRDPVPRRARR